MEEKISTVLETDIERSSKKPIEASQELSLSRRNVLEQVAASLGILGISVGSTRVLSKTLLPEEENWVLQRSHSSTAWLSEQVFVADKLKQHKIRGKLFHLYEGQSIGLGWKIQSIAYAYF